MNSIYLDITIKGDQGRSFSSSRSLVGPVLLKRQSFHTLRRMSQTGYLIPGWVTESTDPEAVHLSSTLRVTRETYLAMQRLSRQVLRKQLFALTLLRSSTVCGMKPLAAR